MSWIKNNLTLLERTVLYYLLIALAAGFAIELLR